MNTPTPEPDVRDIYPVLGRLLNLLAEEVPQAVSRHRTWSIGYAEGPRGISGGIFTDDASGSVLARIADLIGGETTVHSYDSPYDRSGSMHRLHVLHASYRDVTVRITATRPEPTEREQLLARLAELDAADADQDGGAA